MLKEFVAWIKGVISKMFNKSDLAILNKSINISNEMIDRIEKWSAMLKGEAEWINEDVKSLRIESAICQEFANVVTSEMSINVSNDKMNEDIKKALRNLNENLQTGLGLGSFILRSLGEDKVEYLSPDKFIPIKFDANGNLVDVYIIDVRKVSDDNYFYRFERHSLTSSGLTITNQAFKGTKTKIGTSVALSVIDDWSKLTESIIYPTMKNMDLGFYRNPIKNEVDNSFMGVSIFDKAIELIKKADIQYGRLDWEYESAERAIHVDDVALKLTGESSKGKTYGLPKGSKRLYRGLNLSTSSGELMKEYSPTLRDDAFIRGENEYFRRIEFVVSLSYGDLSNVEYVEKSATEVKTAKQKKYNMVNAIEKNLEVCLRDFIIGYTFYNGSYTKAHEVTISFKDSILTNEEQERAQDLIDVNAGIMQKYEYRMKWYGEDEATAKSKIEKEQQGLDGQYS